MVHIHGTIANDNPWKFLHKVCFGQPDSQEMPSLVEIDKPIFDAASGLLYAQTTSPSAADSGGDATPISADIIRGGLLYDDWIIETATTPGQNNPLWAYQLTNTASGTATWRCKECHGGDYKGREGAYRLWRVGLQAFNEFALHDAADIMTYVQSLQ